MGSVRGMASTRFICLRNAKAAGLTTTLARAGCSVCFRRNVCSSPSRLQSMSAWVIDQYGTNGVLRYTEEMTVPTVNFANEVMIKVNAASLNPLDVSMRGKCASNGHHKLSNSVGSFLLPYFSSFRWIWS